MSDWVGRVRWLGDWRGDWEWACPPWPMQIILDNLGSKLTYELVESPVQGTVRDGDGVRLLEISLDGGACYLPIAVNGVKWTFDLATWPGVASSCALLWARDIYGNETSELAALPAVTRVERVYLPRMAR